MRPIKQRGVVLIMSLIILVVISMLALMSVRNSISNEKISGGARQVSLATQAAEIALRYCEQSIISLTSSTATFTTTFNLGSNVMPYSSTPRWQSTTIWDSTSTATFVLGAGVVNQSGLLATFNRPPECMVEPVPTYKSSTVSYTTSYVITARGFGPEVPAAGASRARPDGTEVWLQSTIVLGGLSGGGGTAAPEDGGGDNASNN